MPSGLLHDANVSFYHPSDDFVEYTRGLTWTEWVDNSEFVPSILTSGFRAKSGGNAGEIYYTGTEYDNIVGVSGFACAFWASGFLNDDNKTRSIRVGFTPASPANPNMQDGIELYKPSNPTGFQTHTVVNFIWKGKNWTPPPSNDSDWHFFVMDMRFETGGWRHRISLDGSEWVDLGVDDNSNSFDGGVRPVIEIINLSADTTRVVLDEVVFWADNDLFTSQELSNLYELYNTNNTTMNQYTSIFGIPSSGSVDSFIHGYLPTSGNISLYIPGQVETVSMDLFITGPPFISDNMDNYIRGHITQSGNVNQYIPGHLTSSGAFDLYVSGVLIATSSMSLYIAGPIPVSGNIDNLITGHLPISGDFSLFIQGLIQDINAFVAVSDNNPSNNFDLFIHGVPYGESTIFYTNDAATLFIKDSGEDTGVDSNWSVFAKVVEATTASHSGIWESFVRVGNTINNSAMLYINSHAPGDTPRGISITDSSHLFIAGLSTQDGDEGLLSDGYFVDNLETTAFAKVHLGLNDNIYFYISGEIPAIPPSATLDLFTFGIIDIESNSHTLYISTKESINNNFDLFIFGIQGIESGNLSMYIQVTDIGLLNNEYTLYLHGF